MIPHRDQHLDLCAGYALGSLDPADRAELEAHLEAGCEVCEAALADFSSAAATLAATAPPAAVPPGLKARVMNVVKATPQAGLVRPDAGEGVARDVTPREDTAREVTPREAEAAKPAPKPAEAPKVVEMPRRGWGTGEWLLAAAAVLLAVTTATTWRAAETLRLQLADKQRQLGDLSQQLAEERRWAEVLAAPGAEAASFSLTPAGVKELKARAVYDPASRRAVIVFDHFAAPTGRDYQLWALRGAGVASLGLIKADASGHAVLRLENVDPQDLGGFAVSLEQAGGSPNPNAPAGPVVMAAKLGG